MLQAIADAYNRQDWQGASDAVEALRARFPALSSDRVWLAFRSENGSAGSAMLAEVEVDIQRRLNEAGKTPIEGDNMTDTTSPSTGTATGDAHDLESAIQQCDLIGDDLTRIDTSLDVVDEAIGSAGNATELVEAFLRSKNVDDATVGGMSSAREMLSPDRIKSLIDAVSAAKAGVQNTRELLQTMNDGAAALNGADGSIVNGR
jgi:hypothetical protein